MSIIFALGIAFHIIMSQLRKEKVVTGKISALAVLIFILLFGTIYTPFLYSEKNKAANAIYPEHTKEFFVNDYSHVLNQETREYIYDQAVQLYRETKAQVVVVTVPDLSGVPLETYSLKLANDWGIGDAKKDSGVLILFQTDEPHVRMEVGKGMEGAIPDGKAGRILDDYAVTAKNNGRWNEAAYNTFVATAQEVYKEYDVSPPKDLQITYEQEEFKKGTEQTAEFINKNGKVKYPLRNAFGLSYLYMAILTFVSWFFSLLARISGGVSGGGGSGRSSGGWSSGGGGGFSGGGGSFGGGGASR